MDAVEFALEEIRRKSEEVVTKTAELHQRRTEAKVKRTEEDEERAKLNRDGKNGQDWVILQRRIDNGETTLDQILGGLDKTPVAQNVFKDLKTKMAQVSSRIDKYFEQHPKEKAEYDKLRKVSNDNN